MRGCEITLGFPFQSVDVDIFPDETMPITHFARAIGSTVQTIDKRCPASVRNVETGEYKGHGKQRIQKIISFDGIESVLREYYHYSEADIQTAMQQLRGACSTDHQHQRLLSKKKRSRENSEDEEWVDSDDDDDEVVIIEPQHHPLKTKVRLTLPSLQHEPLPALSPSVLMAPTEPSSPAHVEDPEEWQQDFLVKSQFALNEQVSTFISHMQKTMNMMMAELIEHHNKARVDYLNSAEFKQNRDQAVQEYLESAAFEQEKNAKLKEEVAKAVPVIERIVKAKLKQQYAGKDEKLNSLINQWVDDAVTRNE